MPANTKIVTICPAIGKKRAEKKPRVINVTSNIVKKCYVPFLVS